MNVLRDKAARFWSTVQITPACWEWTGNADKDGYGVLSFRAPSRRAHRYSYELRWGPIPAGLLVRHKCDNPPCVNPEHLELGTSRDNVRDMDERGRRRAPSGERHGCAKLSFQQVAEIRQAQGTQREIAAAYGVAQQTVSRIRTGVLWKEMAS